MRVFLERVNRLLDKIEELLLLIGISGMGLIMTAQVFSRALFGMSIVWSEELTRHIFIWTIFIGMSYGISKYTHVKLDYFIDKFPFTFRKGALIAVNLMLMAMFCCLFFFSIIYVLDQMEIKAPTMGYPMGFVMTAMPVSCALALIRLLFDLTKIAGEEPKGSIAI